MYEILKLSSESTQNIRNKIYYNTTRRCSQFGWSVSVGWWVQSISSRHIPQAVNKSFWNDVNDRTPDSSNHEYMMFSTCLLLAFPIRLMRHAKHS